MQIATLPKAELHWRVDGPENGPPLVFANSLGTDLRLWDGVLPVLPDGLRIIRFDKRGHGLSGCPDGTYAMDDLVEDTEALLDHLGVRDAVFVGLSIGGMIGQGLAAKRRDLVRALVLSNTAARMGSPEMWQARIAEIEAGGMGAVADGVLERWFGPAFRATDAFEAWRNMLLRTTAAGYVGCCHAIAGADLTAGTAALRVPAMGIAGSLDGASPPEQVAETVALIRGTETRVIEGAGHLPCVEKPDAYAGLVTEFLKELGHVRAL